MAPLPCESKNLLALLALAMCCATATGANEASEDAATIPEISSAQIGFDGVYKLGCWTPLTIELAGGAQDWSGQVQVTVPDTDGVPTHVVRAVEVTAGESETVRLSVRIGQSGSPIAVALLSDNQTITAREFYLGSDIVRGTPGGLPATNRILLEVGSTLELDQLLATELVQEQHLLTRVAQVEQSSDLPTDWYGFESVDTVLLATSQPEWYDALRDDPVSLDALERWVESGGRLFLFCAEHAEQLIAEGGVLERFAPGKFDKMERLTQAQPLANFSGSEQAITRNRRLDLRVPSLVEVSGQILASAGRSAASVPLVVRTRRGFGEIVFVGLDFDSKPLNEWPGRVSFFKRLFDWQGRDENQQTVERLDTDDVISHLRNSLDKQFVGVSVIPFGVVAFLAGVYVLLIGPGDYFFVSRVTKRPALTWLTFPLIVLGISALAYGIATRMKGDELRVNQVEIVDVDCTGSGTSRVRGTIWTHLFTPEVDSLDLQLQSNFLGNAIARDGQSLVSWLGLPGYALGGMQANGTQSSIFADGYTYSESLDTLENLPVQNWSTKTLMARWSANVEPSLDFELQADGEELLVGSFTNNSAVELTDCALLYGRWAYNLGSVPSGRSITIDDSRQPRTVKTLLTNSTAGDDTVTRTSVDGTVPFFAAQWDVARLLKAMMFFRAVNGLQYTKLAQRYQPFVDLSKLLESDRQAILLARVESTGSQWKLNSNYQADREGDDPSNDVLASDSDRRWTYYRFVINVESPESSD